MDTAVQPRTVRYEVTCDGQTWAVLTESTYPPNHPLATMGSAQNVALRVAFEAWTLGGIAGGRVSAWVDLHGWADWRVRIWDGPPTGEPDGEVYRDQADGRQY
jgi:hypothetical protein